MRELTLVLQPDAVGCTALGLFRPRLRIAIRCPRSGLIQSGQWLRAPCSADRQGWPHGLCCRPGLSSSQPGGCLAASPAPLSVHSLLRVPGSSARSRRPIPGTTTAPCRPAPPGATPWGTGAPGGCVPLGLDRGSPAGAEPCRQGPGWQGASPPWGGDTGNFDHAFRLVSSIKGEALAGWAG